MINPWDSNALHRHQQLLSRKDVTFWKVVAPRILALVRNKMSKTPPRLLDIGCGTGVLTGLLSEVAYEILAIDPSEDSISIASDHLAGTAHVTLMNASIQDLEASRVGLFDIIVANMVLQATDPLEPVFETIASLMAPQATLIASIPHPCFWAQYRREVRTETYAYHVASEHLIPFTTSIDTGPLPSPVPYFHRPLESYSSHLFSCGLGIVRIFEPMPDLETMTQYPQTWDYPRFMILECALSPTQEA